MKVMHMEPLDEYGTYKATVVVSRSNGWKFWQQRRQTLVYVGNLFGWFNAETGAAITDKMATAALCDALRVIKIKELLNEKKPPLKPVN